MPGKRAVKPVKFLIIAAIAIPLFGLLVRSLWNWLMPAVFSLPPITFWQALGLFFLSRILFGRFGGDHGRRFSRRRTIERWERMSPEERERFRAGIERWCADYRTAARERGSTSDASS